MEYLPETNIAVGLRMRQIRRAYRMTQEKLADTLGVSVNYLGEVERGRKPLSRSLADQFCQYFHVSYDYLYHGSNAPASDQIRERATYNTPEHFLLQQVRGCSPEEIHMFSQIISSYMDYSRHMMSKQAQKNHQHRQDHTCPEHQSTDLF